MKITKRQLRRIIREEIDRMTGLPVGTPVTSVEVEWYGHEHTEGEGISYVVPTEVVLQGENAIRDYIDGKFYPRYKYLITKESWREIDELMGDDWKR